MILSGEIIAVHDMLTGRDLDPQQRDEFIGHGRVIIDGGGNDSD